MNGISTTPTPSYLIIRLRPDCLASWPSFEQLITVVEQCP
jgi:hypothetical protein